MPDLPTAPMGSTEVVIPDFLLSSVPFDYGAAIVAAPKMPRCDVSRDGELVFKTDDIFHREKALAAVIIGIGTPRVVWETDKVAKGTPPICASPDGRSGQGTCQVDAGERSFVPLNRDDIEAWRKAGYDVDDHGYFTAGDDSVNFKRDCQGCPMAEWGSSLKGKGQRCRMTIRVALYVPTFIADQQTSVAEWLSDETGEKPGAAGPPVILNVTPTNFDEWDLHMKAMTKMGMGRVAPWGFWTTIEASKKQAGGYDVGKLAFKAKMMEAGHTWFYAKAKELQDHPSMSEFNTAGSADDYAMQE